MNHFFALSLPNALRQQLNERVNEWTALVPPTFSARWYVPEDYHITLKFLGDMDEVQQADLIGAVTPVAVQASPVRIVITRRFGAFPNKRLPRVLWAGVVPDPSLAILAEQVEKAMDPFGFKREGRAFLPHITLARCRPAPDKNLLPLLPSDERWGQTEFIADQFHLVQTLPPEKGANGPRIRYNIVHTFPFGE